MAFYGNSDEYWARKKMAQDEAASKSAWDAEKQSYGNLEGTQDLSGPIGEGVAETDWMGNSNLTQNEATPSNEAAVGAKPGAGAAGGMAGAANAIQSGGGPMDIAGSGMVGMGAATANPYLVGAGLAVTAASSIQKGKREAEKNRYLAEVQKYNARQNALQNLAQLGAGLKA